MTTRPAHVTDTNHQPRGVMSIEIAFYANAPVSVTHAGQTYAYTGKSGTNLKTGLAVREMATDEDARLWVSLDGQQVWED